MCCVGGSEEKMYVIRKIGCVPWGIDNIFGSLVFVKHKVSGNMRIMMEIILKKGDNFDVPKLTKRLLICL